MLSFMDKNYQDVSKLLPDHYTYPAASSPTSHHLAYDDGKCRIGFNYSTMDDPERRYIWALLRWMSLQVGRKRKLEIFYDTGIKKIVPYIVYDGLKAMPVVLVEEWKNEAPPRDSGSWEMHDELGWRVTENAHANKASRLLGIFSKKRKIKEFQVLREEIKRLDGLWKALK